MFVKWGEIKIKKECYTKYFDDNEFSFVEKNAIIIQSPVFSDNYSARSWVYQELRRIAFLGGCVSDFYAFSPIQYGFQLVSCDIDESFANLIGKNPQEVLKITNGRMQLDLEFQSKKFLINQSFGMLNEIGLPIGFEEPFLNDYVFGDSIFLKGGKRRIGPDKPLVLLENKDDIENLKNEILQISEKCINSKRWTIPCGAILDTRLANFRYIELQEQDDSVIFIFRNDTDYFTCSFNGNTSEWNLDAVNIGFDGSKSEYTEEHKVTINYICCLILHDFWVPVIKERDSVYNPTKKLSSSIAKWAKPADDDRKSIVYLPRYLYINGKIKSGLFHKTYNETIYKRKAHNRNLKGKKASLKQLLLAAQYGIKIPKGFTFVRATNIDELTENQSSNKQYVSRTLLGSIYDKEMFSSSSIKIKWQKFEEDVKQWLEDLGFTIIPGKWCKRGDKGIDVKAFDKNNVLWLIQCKCWSKNRIVGPNVLREIWGSQRELEKEIDIDNSRESIRTAIITTSSFSESEEFRESARKAGTVLIDGDMFINRFWPK